MKPLSERIKLALVFGLGYALIVVALAYAIAYCP